MDPQLLYLQNQVNSATPTGLVVLLYDGLLKFSHQAIDHFNDQGPESNRLATESIDRCIKILTELNSALSHDQAPELCSNLSNLYSFFSSEFSKALSQKDPKIIEDICPLIENLRDGWKQVDESIQKSS